MVLVIGPGWGWACGEESRQNLWLGRRLRRFAQSHRAVLVSSGAHYGHHHRIAGMLARQDARGRL